jgi:hypothetical protein
MLGALSLGSQARLLCRTGALGPALRALSARHSSPGGGGIALMDPFHRAFTPRLRMYPSPAGPPSEERGPREEGGRRAAAAAPGADPETETTNSNPETETTNRNPKPETTNPSPKLESTNPSPKPKTTNRNPRPAPKPKPAPLPTVTAADLERDARGRVVVPPAPVLDLAPAPDEPGPCCGNGCADCVLVEYHELRSAWAARQKRRLQRHQRKVALRRLALLERDAERKRDQ